MSWTLGITTWSLPGNGVYSAAIARELGFDSIQPEVGGLARFAPWTSVLFQRLLTQECRDRHLALLPVTINGVCSHPFVGGLDTADGRAALRIIDAGLQAAAALGTSGVTIPNFGANELHTQAHFDATVEALRYACDRAAPLGLTVYTENVLPSQALEELFDRVGSDRLRLLFDSQNYAALGHDWTMDVLRAFYDRMGSCLHVKDGDTGMGALPLGQGNCPLNEVTSFLKSHRYEGTIILENNYDDAAFCRRQNRDAFELIAQDIRTLRSLMDD